MSPVITNPSPGRPARPSLLDDHLQVVWDERAEQAVLGGAF